MKWNAKQGYFIEETMKLEKICKLFEKEYVDQGTVVKQLINLLLTFEELLLERQESNVWKTSARLRKLVG